MSKLIKVTPERIEECKRDFIAALSEGKFSDGKATFTKDLGTLDRKAKIFFTELAWLKMQTLVREFSKEVAWHGLAYRGDEADTYYITDILVYPQEVTGATVTTDQEKYQMWLMNHDDEVFNNIRMQGHSHVNMGVTPSAVDDSLYERLLEQLDDDMFYIFMIWNKSNSKHVKIYDLRENVLFENADIKIEIMDDGTGIEKFVEDAKKMVVDKPAYQYPYNNSYGTSGGVHTGARQNSQYDSYYGKNRQGAYDYSTPSGYSKKEDTGLGKTQALTESKDKKGKRKGKRKKNDKSGNDKQVSLKGYGYDYEDDDTSMDEYYERMYGRREWY